MMKTRTVLGALLVAFFAVTIASAQDTEFKEYKFQVFEPIPDADPAGVSNTQSVPDSGEIVDVDVDLLIEHTWQGDLIVDISHNGVTVPLLYRAGDSQSGGFGFSADNYGDPLNGEKFILDDEAMDPYDSASPNGIGNVADPGFDNVTGNWLPYGANGLMLFRPSTAWTNSVIGH